MTRNLVLLAVICLLGGCMASRNSGGLTSEQQAYYTYFLNEGLDKNRAMLAAVSPIARQLFFDDKTCQSHGAKLGSDAYVACRAQLEAGHRVARTGPST